MHGPSNDGLVCVAGGNFHNIAYREPRIEEMLFVSSLGREEDQIKLSSNVELPMISNHTLLYNSMTAT